MADLNIIYRIAADISGLQDGVNRAARSTEKLEGLATKVAGAFAGMFTVSAAIGFGKALLDDADALVKLSDKTGVSITGLQRFQVAGDDAGNTVDELTSAITKMEDKLAGGDRSAVAALQKLGLSLEDLKTLNPENQFIAISDAIRKIQDPAQQVAIAMDLFGRQGAEILPTLKRGFDDVKGAAVGMSEDTARELDAIGDSLSKAWRTTKGFAADAVVFLANIRFWQNPIGQARHQVELFNDELERMAQNIKSAPKLPSIGELQVPKSDDPRVQRAAKEDEDALNRLIAARKRAAEDAKRAVEDLRKTLESLNNVHIGSVDLDQLADQIFEAEKRTVELREVLLKIDTSTLRTTADNFRDLGIQIDDIRESLFEEFGSRFEAEFVGPIWDGVEAVKSLGARLKDVASTSLGGLNDIFQRAFEGGGGVTGAIKSFATNFATGLLDMIPVIGPYISQFAGAIVAGVSKLFGGLFGDREHMRVNDMRDEFVDAAGGLDELNKRAHDAGLTLDHFLHAKTVEDYTAAVNELNAAFDRLDSVRSGAHEFGLSRTELSEAERNAHEIFDYMQQSGEYTAEQLEAAYYAWQKAMADAGNVAAQEWIKVHDGVISGATAANKAIDDLTRKRDGLAASIADEADEAVKGSIQLGIEAQIAALDAQVAQQKSEIEKQAEEAAETIEKELNDINPDTVTIEYEYRMHGDLPPWMRDFPSGEVPEPIPMALGGSGMVTKPTLFLAGEYGPEQFAFSGGGQRFSESGTAESQPEVRQPVLIQLMQDRRVSAEVMIDNILKDEGGIRRVIQRVAVA